MCLAISKQSRVKASGLLRQTKSVCAEFSLERTGVKLIFGAVWISYTTTVPSPLLNVCVGKRNIVIGAAFIWSLFYVDVFVWISQLLLLLLLLYLKQQLWIHNQKRQKNRDENKKSSSMSGFIFRFSVDIVYLRVCCFPLDLFSVLLSLSVFFFFR